MQTKSTAAGCGLVTAASDAGFDAIECSPTHSGVKTHVLLAVTALAQPRYNFVCMVTAKGLKIGDGLRKTGSKNGDESFTRKIGWQTVFVVETLAVDGLQGWTNRFTNSHGLDFGRNG
jgi:hypothetical protein